MTFYFVGPSGAGKTTLALGLEAEGLVQFVDADADLKGVEGDWVRVLERLECWDSNDDKIPLLVAIGAGTQDIDRNHEEKPVLNWLDSRREKLFAIMCTPEETWSRRSQFHDTLASVLETEFAPARVLLYKAASGTVWTSDLTESQAVDELNYLLRIEAQSAQVATAEGYNEQVPV